MFSARMAVTATAAAASATAAGGASCDPGAAAAWLHAGQPAGHAASEQWIRQGKRLLMLLLMPQPVMCSQPANLLAMERVLPLLQTGLRACMSTPDCPLPCLDPAACMPCPAGHV